MAGLPKSLPIVQAYIGNGLVTLNGAEWHRHRTIIQPGFAGQYVRNLMESALPPLLENMCRSWEKLPPGTPVSIQDHLQSLTLDTIGRAGFGHEFGMTKELLRWADAVKENLADRRRRKGDNDENGGGHVKFADLPPRDLHTHPIAAAFSSQEMTVIRPTLTEIAFGPWYTRLASNVFRGSRSWRRAAVVRRTDKAIEEIVREQRERCREKEAKLTESIRRRSSAMSEGEDVSPPRASDGGGGHHRTSSNGVEAKPQSDAKFLKSVRKTPRSILELLISDFSGLTDAELRDECKTFIFAGAETTSNAVSLSVFAMLTTPERGDGIQRRLYEDIVHHWPDSSIPPTADQLNKMEYLQAVLKEGLRMYPPVGMIFRIADKRLESFCGAGPIPKGTRLVLSIYLLHRNPDVWGERADEFVPERWMSDPAVRAAVPGGGVEPAPDDPFSYVPFSGGGRQCIGKSFAMLEAKMILATIVRRFRFKLAEELRGATFEMTSFITMRPKPHFVVEAEPRKD
uniref:Cytochrome P450 n=1 Tax=Odontella aurita TaxID=265563 RepID=A0A6U6IM60_9STRA